ncbi:hypothetical protein ACFXP7_11550 [Microbacterium sp. P06]|uniref:hypothetical protein n=1 Tax=Microbacterium sp. P06 TaxID=3366949 RepID=UPI0037456B1D
MIENFLRAPRTPGAYFADAVRVVGALSVIAAALWWTPTDAGIVALTLPALLVPRFVGVRPSFDIAACLTILIAAWSNVFDLYTSVPGWDLLIHFACTGVLAVLVYLLLSFVDVTPPPHTPAFTRRAAVVLVTAFGLALSALWEVVEWLGETFVTDEIFVTYSDTIGDMVLGGLGALVAAVFFARAPAART